MAMSIGNAATRPIGGGLPTGSRWPRRPDAVPLHVYWQLLRQNLAVLAVGAMLGLAVGGVQVARQPPVWVSGSTVLAPAIAMDPQTPADRLVRPRLAMTLDSEAAVLRSDEVLRRAVSGTSLTPIDLTERISITAIPNSRVLRLQVRDSDRQRTQLLATSLAAAYLDSRQQLLAERRSQQTEALRREIAALQSRSQTAEAAFAVDRERRAPNALSSVVDIRIKVQALRQKLIDLESTRIVAGELLRSATAPRRVQSQSEIHVISWLLLGLAASGAVAAFRRRRSTTSARTVVSASIPRAGSIPVALVGAGDEVPDRRSSWVRIAELIGPRPRVILVVALDDAPLDSAVRAMDGLLRRRGSRVCDIVIEADEHEPGEVAGIRRLLAQGRHVLVHVPSLRQMVTGLSTTVGDGVIFTARASGISRRRLVEASDEASRLRLKSFGLVLVPTSSDMARTGPGLKAAP